MSLRTAQLCVVAQVAVAGAATVAFVKAAAPRFAAASPAVAACAPRDAPVIAMRLIAAAALPLLMAVAAVGNYRFIGRGGIDPTRHDAVAGSVLARNLTNTLEQYLLFAAALAGLAAWGRCSTAAALAAWFMLARAAFVVGYLIHPIARGVGFAAGQLPTLWALVLCASSVWRLGPGHGL